MECKSKDKKPNFKAVIGIILTPLDFTVENTPTAMDKPH